MASGLGALTLVRDADGLRGLYLPHHWYMPNPATFGRVSDDGFAEAVTQVGQYLAGNAPRVRPSARPGRGRPPAPGVAARPADPYAQTLTYGELATYVGDGATAQQIGAAAGRDPPCILIPCHRVVGRGGKLTGYAGGARNRHLLEPEREQVAVDERTRCSKS